MPRLLLLRHAKSSWKEPGLADRERPLTARGRRACELIAGHIADAGIRPGAVVCSPAVRARQTLDGIRGALPDEAPLWEEPRIYMARAVELLELARELPADLESALLIGHNPGFQSLAELLAGDGEELPRLRRKFPTAALATLRFDGGWGDLAPERAELEAFVSPKQLARRGKGPG